MPNPMHMQC